MAPDFTPGSVKESALGEIFVKAGNKKLGATLFFDLSRKEALQLNTLEVQLQSITE